MSVFFPRFAYTPVRCAAPTFRHEVAPLWSLFDDATRQFQQLERAARRAPAPFHPRFDVKEEKEAYVLEGEVPGFQESDLSIEWKDNVLAIRGKHESATESGKKPEAVEAQAEKAITQDETATPAASEAGSVKSHQATVEDEEPANASAVAAESSSQTAAPTLAEQPTEQTAAQTETKTEPQVQHWISERRSGQFLRQFQFPSNAISHEAIKASLQSGILKIVVPKAPIPESRRINIE